MSDPSNAVERRGTTNLRGVVRNVQFRSEAQSDRHAVQVLTFRLEQSDAVGNQSRPVLVELRGLALEGQVVDGEDVTVAGRWRRGRLVAKEVVSETTGASVRARQGPVWLMVPLIVLVLAFIAFVVFKIATGLS